MPAEPVNSAEEEGPDLQGQGQGLQGQGLQGQGLGQGQGQRQGLQGHDLQGQGQQGQGLQGHDLQGQGQQGQGLQGQEQQGQGLQGQELHQLLRLYKEEREQLSKDVLYYKQSCKDLKRRLKAEVGLKRGASAQKAACCMKVTKGYQRLYGRCMLREVHAAVLHHAVSFGLCLVAHASAQPCMSNATLR